MAYNKETGKFHGYVYKITNCINGKIYIGVTTRTIQIRFNEHATCVKRQPNRPSVIGMAIAKHGQENFKVEQLNEIITDSKDDLNIQLNTLEREYIKNFCSDNKDIGYNRTMGGDAAANSILRPVIKYDVEGRILARYESEMLAATENNLSFSDISKCCNGTSSGYLVGGFRWSFEGEKYRESKNNIVKNREVSKYDLDGNLIQVYDCVNSISEDSHLKNRIRNCCKGRQYNVDGFVYRYNSDPFDKYPTRKKEIINNSPVDQFSMDGTYIATYLSIKEASLTTGVHTNGISHNCMGKIKSSGGFVWKYHAN